MSTTTRGAAAASGRTRGYKLGTLRFQGGAMVYAWLIRVGHDVYEPKEIPPVQEGFGGVYVDS